MTFGETLKKLRTDNQLTQEDLADKLYVTRTAISKWETGRGFPAIDNLKEIATLFGVSIDSLIGDEDVTSYRLLEEQRARRFYWAAIACLAAAVGCALGAYFLKQPALNALSTLAVLAYIGCGLSAKPKYKRMELKKLVVPYVISRLVILLVVIGAILLAFRELNA